ncbi:MAG TPA: glycosyl hydrolase family 32 [Lachnoclostridium sp.]|jgi:fructan beta-fructosidase|uniref:glycoside hydrolase family 32 protein n=1 Tax=Lacrimispora sp. TaxID=2719234 RepID=UPI000EC2FB8C|nr:glycoside hydrolase family 32 protein [Lacrimispora sp.]HCD44337.1 glycosyl hydrolase family 32 [Lachnoclostridium sp.]
MSTKGVRDFRPKIHFTPLNNWSNDPNGMVYMDGFWHLYYQYHPERPVWGPMHWGHAVSRDLLYWEHHPIAMHPDEMGYIFSGSMAYDKENTSGFGKDGAIPVVAMYTSHRPEDRHECQSIAYSLDGGFHFEKYYGNPVIDNPGLSDFRDPKVFWNGKRNCWSMILAAENCAFIYASIDLKKWEKTGEFGRKENLVESTWECTDLFPLQTEEGEKWVMLVSMMARPGKGCANIQYFIGEFDGNTFHAKEQGKEPLWLDFGFDNYAGVTFHNYDKPIYLGWGVSPEYANQVPTGEFAGLMTVARELSLIKTEWGYRLAAKPFGLDRFRAAAYPVADGGSLISECFGLKVHGQSGKIIFTNGKKQKLVIEIEEESIRIDRSLAGASDFSEKYCDKLHSVGETKRLLRGDVDMELLFDVSYLEVFADKGLETASMTVYPDVPFEKISIQGNLTAQIYQIQQ